MRETATEQRPDPAEAKFARVFAVCPDIITITALATGRYLDVNDAFTRVMGYGRDEVIGRTSSDIGIWETPQERQRLLEALSDSTRLENFAVRIRRKDGEVVDALLSAERTVLDGEECLIIVGRDISDRIQVEKALSDSETRFRLAMEASNDGLWDWDIRTDQAYFSPAYFRMLGFEPGELPATGRTWRGLLHPEDRQRAEAVAQDCIEGGGDGFSAEFRLRAKNGGWRWVLCRGRAFGRGPDGRASRLIGTHLDITDHKEFEDILSDKNRALERSNADLEQFAYVASHDLQTPLRNIIRYAQLLELRYKNRLDSDADDFIGFIVDSGKHMARLINDLLEFSRASRQAAPLAPIPVGDAIAQALKNLDLDLARAGGEVKVGDLPVVMADEVYLVSLFQNLLGNAIKYRSADRTLVLSVEAERVSREFWRFAVADNGIGIDPEYHEKIFEIFQRLNPASDADGTGVGLTLCRRIVHRFGGTIWLQSEPGRGTTFFFLLRDGAAASG